ncbi:hypothetical protein BBK82_26660 [Lentzea guizhouensis]|uniref:Uncharacterized protein n=1 Tax=Lentzea guizhouensis TaxID=1586287 RepID=A0A1B2HN46_9PSEU|nr:hypothetical protein BBK82_26660 [Lentzea guizhouensis]
MVTDDDVRGQQSRSPSLLRRHHEKAAAHSRLPRDQMLFWLLVRPEIGMHYQHDLVLIHR